MSWGEQQQLAVNRDKREIGRDSKWAQLIDEIDNCSASLVQKCAYKIRMNNLVSQLGRKNTFRRQRNDSRFDLTVNQLRAMSSSYAIKKAELCICKSVFLFGWIKPSFGWFGTELVIKCYVWHYKCWLKIKVQARKLAHTLQQTAKKARTDDCWKLLCEPTPTTHTQHNSPSPV